VAEQDGAPGTAEQSASEGEGAKKGLFASPIVKVGLFVLLLGVNAVVSFLVVQKVIRPKVGTDGTDPAEERVDVPEPGELFVLESIIVNPAGTRATRYLRVAAALEYEPSEEALAEELEQRRYQLRDLFLTELASRTLDELVDSRVKEEIREDLLARLNGSVRNGQLKNLYFTEYVIQ